MFTRNGFLSEASLTAASAIHSAGLTITWCVVLISLLVLSVTLGCGGGDAQSATNDGQSEAGNASDNKAIRLKNQIRDQLVGVWLGGAYLDEDLLAQRLQDCTPEAGDEILRKAQYFAGTMMAIDFRPDGSLENEIEIVPPSGQPQREQGLGSWRIAQIAEDGFVVEIAEKHIDGSVTKSQKVYRFYDDGDHFAVSIPLDGVLGECNPLIVFERQSLDSEPEVVADASQDSTQR